MNAQAQAWLLIVGGSLIVAVGGALATWGWNSRSTIETRDMLAAEASRGRDQQRASILRAVHQEFVVNTHALRNIVREPDSANLRKIEAYERIHSASLLAAITSGALVEDRDEKVLVAVWNEYRSVQIYNHVLDLLEQITVAKMSEVEPARRRAREGAELVALREAHRKLGAELEMAVRQLPSRDLQQ